NSPGTSQTFTVSGSNLTASLSITAPAGVQISSNGTTFGSSLNLTPNALGTVATTTIYVRIASSATAGTVSGNIAVTSSGATTKQIAVSGTVTSGTSTGIGNTFYFLGSNTLSTTSGGSAQSTTIASASGTNHDGTPTNALVYQMSGLTGTYDPTK